jgi:hypothetical protein
MKRKDNVTMKCVRNFASSVIPRWSHRLILQWSHFCGYFTVVYITECDYSYYGLLSYFCKETIRLRCIYYSKFIGHFVTSHRRPDGTFCNCWLRATSHTESVVTFIIHLYITFHFPRYKLCRCQWPRGLSRGCVPAGLLGLGSNPWEWEPVMYMRLGGH